LFVIFLLGVGIYGAFRWVTSLTPEQLLQSELTRDLIRGYIGEENKDLVDLVPPFLGFDEPRTYLLLFLNNTEIRPGGGFIGSYATVRVDKGHVEILAFDGTENLDAGTPKDWSPVPPSIITRELYVDKWYFRDSNWSPDFAVNAKQALLYYRAEGGTAAQEIDAIVGVTPTVLEELLRLTGPLTIQGMTFTADTVTKQLEDEVEFQYKQRGLAVEERKQILQPFFRRLIDTLAIDAFAKPDVYLTLIKNMIAQRHIMGYAFDADLQKPMKELDLVQSVAMVDYDYLMWVDANLGALKTDAVIRRHVTYETRDIEGAHYRVARMTYVHPTGFDKFTTRYRTYARAFVPKDSILHSATIINPNGTRTPIPVGEVDQGVDLDKQWFGAFTVIEPNTTESLEFVYQLSPAVRRQIDNGGYQLLVQKQPGTTRPELTLDLGFDTTIAGANPGEQEAHFGDSRYQIETDLLVDRSFAVEL